MYCSRCGIRNRVTARFCQKCGGRLYHGEAAAEEDRAREMAQKMEVSAKDPHGPYFVWMDAHGSQKVRIINALAKILGVPAHEANAFTNSLPKIVRTVDTKVDAEALVKQLRELGASTRIVPRKQALTKERAAGNEAPAETAGDYKVIVQTVGPRRIGMGGKVRKLTGKPMAEVNRLLDRVPFVVARGVSRAQARKLGAELEELGAVVRLEDKDGTPII